MRLLLTSDGLSDPAIVDALIDLHGRPLTTARVAFVPTASNLEVDDKCWLVDDMYRFRSQELEHFDIVDLAALDTDTVHRRLAVVNVIVFGGGDTYYLLDWIERHGMRQTLPQLLRERVYVGISAGSMAAGPHLAIDNASSIWGELGGSEDPWRLGLGYVDFYFRPHLRSPHVPTSQEPAIAAVAARLQRWVYAADDLSALSVRDGIVTPVGSGAVLVYNE